MVKRKLNKCGFYDFATADPICLSRGLCFAWKANMDVTLIKFSSFFMHIDVYDCPKSVKWATLLVYASCDDSVREGQFEFLLSYKTTMAYGCLVAGDFNTILWSWEKKGRIDINSNQASIFNDFVTNFALCDMGFSGPTFTWNNRRYGLSYIQERLDRSLASYEWRLVYPNAVVLHLEDLASNHPPMIINFKPHMSKAKRFFKFDTRWVPVPETKHVIEDVWKVDYIGSNMFKIF